MIINLGHAELQQRLEMHLHVYLEYCHHNSDKKKKHTKCAHNKYLYHKFSLITNITDAKTITGNILWNFKSSNLNTCIYKYTYM